MINYTVNYCGSYFSLRLEAGRGYIHALPLYYIRYISKVGCSAFELRHLRPFALRPFRRAVTKGLSGIGEWIPGKLAEG